LVNGHAGDVYPQHGHRKIGFSWIWVGVQNFTKKVQNTVKVWYYYSKVAVLVIRTLWNVELLPLTTGQSMDSRSTFWKPQNIEEEKVESKEEKEEEEEEEKLTEVLLLAFGKYW
jgi:hypothetical protein